MCLSEFVAQTLICAGYFFVYFLTFRAADEDDT